VNKSRVNLERNIFKMKIFLFLFAIFGILPSMIYAGGMEIDSKPVRINAIEAIPVIFQDSIPIRRGGDKKEQDRPAADTRQNGNRPGENRPGENRPGENRPGENRPGVNRPGENRPEEIRRLKEINAENQRIREKSEIKQVPRSIPKLKPKAVTDRVPIRRPPMRIPKKGVGAIHF
jgi:hypothetical protein